MAKFDSKTHQQDTRRFRNPPARKGYVERSLDKEKAINPPGGVPTVGMRDTGAGPSVKTLRTTKHKQRSTRPDHW